MPLFPGSKAVLAAGAGTLAEAPFPLLLHALFEEERTCTLHLTRNALEKRVHFEDGAPVACTSNLLHETLGRFLVEEERLTETQAQELLAESIETGKRLGELLVEKGLLPQAELLKLMQKNLALRILDGFAWTAGSWRLEPVEGNPDPVFRLNPAQLVLTGCIASAPFDLIAQGLVFFDEQRFVLVPRPPHDRGALKLGAKDKAMLDALAHGPTFSELTARTKVPTEDAMRRLYALMLLGFVGLAEEVAAAPVVEAPAPTAERGVAEVPAEVVDLFLRHRTMDPFDLLGVGASPAFAELKGKFLALARRTAPWDPAVEPVADKAEVLFLALARAYAELADPERRSQALKRRHNTAEAKRTRKGPDFRIQTDLLDAGTQFQAGLRFLEDGDPAAAIRQLEYAADIEPRRATFKAHLAWARYLADPDSAWEASLRDLGAVLEADPRCAEAAYFDGEIRRARGDLAGAEASLRRAVKLAPDRPEYGEALRSLAKASKD